MPFSHGGPPHVGSTEWAARQIYRILDKEEREKAKKWRPKQATLTQSAAGPSRTASAGGAPVVYAEDDHDGRRLPESSGSSGSRGTAPSATSSRTSLSPEEIRLIQQWQHDDPSALSQATLLDRFRTVTGNPGLRAALGNLPYEMAANLKVPEAAQPAADELKQRFIQAILQDPAITDASVRWRDMAIPKSFAREEILKRIVAHHARIYGHDMPEVRFGTLKDASGIYNPNSRTLTIDPLTATFKEPRKVFGTAAHEAMHGHQWDLAQDYGAARIAPNDPLYPLAEVMRRNYDFYTKRETDRARYGRQPIEMQAAALADAVSKAVLEKWQRDYGIK